MGMAELLFPAIDWATSPEVLMADSIEKGTWAKPAAQRVIKAELKLTRYLAMNPIDFSTRRPGFKYDNKKLP